MLRSRLSQMLIYWRVNSASRKARASPERKISNFEIGFSINKRLIQAWRLLRRLSGDDAYERYLDHIRAVHGDTFNPLDRAAYYRELTSRRWSGVKRCC